MLSITPAAAAAVRHIIGSSVLAEGAGIRISAKMMDDGLAALELTLSEGPASTDQVVERDDGQVFVEPEVADLLDDKILDATPGDDEYRFTLRDQPLAA